MRLRMTDKRERRIEDLVEATGENTKSGALDQAARYYVRMAGGTSAVPDGRIQELMALAIEEGSVTADQIAEVLDVDELPVNYERSWSVGRAD